MDEAHSPFRNRGRRRGEEGARKESDEGRNKEAPIQVADPRSVQQQLPRAAMAAAAVLSRDSSIIRG